MQNAAGLSGPDEVDIHPVEDGRMLRESRREILAVLDVLHHLLQDRLHRRIVGLLLERPQARRERNSRVHERREHAREAHELAGRDLSLSVEDEPEKRRVLFLDEEHFQVLLAEQHQNVALRGRIHHAFHKFPALGEGFVEELSH